MANNPAFERFREIIWQRALTDAEQAELEAWLAANPEFRTEWQAEMSLSVSLRRLPAPEVPSNFTARVLQAVERERENESRPQETAHWWHAVTRKARWVTTGALATISVLIALGIHQKQVEKQHELALMNRLRELPNVPNTDVLANFETIRVLNQAPSPDDQLLALLE